ncbi:MAG: hypothetical protein E5Y69_29735 [Mesorhizobium sp.]|nr:MAG: hypothetical protein E5Y69_29735 [Mesorhizobium sp.]
MEKRKSIIAGFDIGGAHLKVTRAQDGRIVEAVTIATPLWLGLDNLASAFEETAPIYAGADLNAFTMTGELADIFPSRDAGVAALLDEISSRFPGEKLIYAGPFGFVGVEQAARLCTDVASANWHATASLVAKLAGDALFVDMGSTTTDILAVKNGAVANDGYTDAGRLLTGELVYTGFTRTFLFGVASSAPVRGRLTPLMNEYFASIADAHRILEVLDEKDDRHSTADGKEKTIDGSIARLARMIGRDAADLTPPEWREIARWFSEQQLRKVHDAASLVAGPLARWQIRRLAERMERRFVDFAEIIPADDAVRGEASSVAPASAVALLAGSQF